MEELLAVTRAAGFSVQSCSAVSQEPFIVLSRHNYPQPFLPGLCPQLFLLTISLGVLVFVAWAWLWWHPVLVALLWSWFWKVFVAGSPGAGWSAVQSSW